MAKQNDKVMALVARELEANPKITVPELMEKAQKVDAAVAKLTARQFNARYPLQIKRRRAAGARPAAAPGRKRAARAATPKRAARAPGRKRAAAPTRGARRRAGRPARAGANRDGIRGVFLRFAKELARAEGKAELVDLIGAVDNRVEQVIKLAGSR